MRFRFMAMMMVILLFPVAVALSGGAEEVTPEDPVDMRIASTGGTDSLRGDALRFFQEEIANKTDGAINVRLYLDGQLGGDEDNTYQLQEGSVEAIFNGTAPHFLFGDEMEIEYWPFIFDDADHLVTFYDTSDFVQEVNEMLIEEMGIRSLVLATRGPRHITSDTPIERPEDLEGLQFRTPGIDSVVRAFEGLGANVVSLPVPELITGLETGMVDGQENPLDNIYSWGLYDVQDYLTLTYHTYSGRMFYVNEQFWQGLPEDLQQAVVSTAEEMAAFIRENIERADEEYLAELEERGMEVIHPDVEAFQAAFEEALKDMPQGHQDLYWEARALVD